MKKTFFLLFATGTIAATSVAQDIKEKEVARIIGTLAADDMQGRLPGTPGIEKAAAFISSEFAKVRLAPLPGEKSYLQEFNKYYLGNSSISLTVNGEQKNWTIIPLGNTQVFDWEKDSTCEEVHVNDVKEFMKIARSAVPLQKNTLIWLSPEMAGYIGGITASFSERVFDSKEALEEAAAKNADNKRIVVVVEREPVLAGATWKLSVHRTINTKHFANVAGMIKGSTKPNEYVVFSGHYDHLGILPPVAGDSIANGADDDASGTTAVIMLSKYFNTHRPQRSVILVAFTAEETGGYGSRYFSEKQDPDKVVAMFNIEMIGKESKFGKNSAFITGFERSDFGSILQRNLKGSAFSFYPDPYPEQHLFYRSDNATLARQGVPAHTISTTQIDKDKYYHTVGDEVSTLDIKNIIAIINAIAISSGSIVNGTDTPTRILKNSLE
ncbi:M20/M25/M40 family metallo-hydrolase [Chitinophaga sp. 30R24]|uniref:M20/M25/M40 family metallo-hydrolase n=1 Tax=Chitinophaga sp. 30R24 TaxID=3248838 RepID=UPI003B903094